MTLRIVEIHRVLKPTGSFYLHCDPTASHYLKLVLDAVFCGQGGDFRNEISWRRTTAKSDHAQGAMHFPRVRDIILRYSKRTDAAIYNQQFAEYTDAYIASKYASVDANGRRYMLDNLTGPGGASKGNAFYEVMGVSRHWRYSKANMERLIAEGRIVQPSPGSVPRYKRFLDEMPGVSVSDDWDDIRPINSQAQERLGYPTQKPEALLERIIKASSNEGDTVLDAYCGCGTTVAVAQRLGRRWIGIDVTYQSIALILKRFADTYKDDWPAIEADIKLDGVPRDIDSAMALANRKDDKTRKEFEKWAVLTYSRNQARINEKKGADGGIDGIVYFLNQGFTVDHRLDNDKGFGDRSYGKAIFQVKSRSGTRADLATLNSDRLREQAEIGFLICTSLPTKPMREEIAAAGKFKHPLMNREDDRLQVITVAELFQGKRLDLPMARADAVKAAAAKGDADKQVALDL
jgi:DNA modification methylase